MGSSDQPIFKDGAENSLDNRYVLVEKNPKYSATENETCKFEISRQIVKVLRTLTPPKDALNLCEAVFVVLVKVLNSGSEEIFFEKGDELAVIRREKPAEKEAVKNRSNGGNDGEALPCPMTPPPTKKAKKKKDK